MQSVPRSSHFEPNLSNATIGVIGIGYFEQISLLLIPSPTFVLYLRLSIDGFAFTDHGMLWKNEDSRLRLFSRKPGHQSKIIHGSYVYYPIVFF